jgi:hypothetical protein
VLVLTYKDFFIKIRIRARMPSRVGGAKRGPNRRKAEGEEMDDNERAVILEALNIVLDELKRLRQENQRLTLESLPSQQRLQTEEAEAGEPTPYPGKPTILAAIASNNESMSHH